MPILIKGSGGKKAKLQPKSTTPTKSEQTIMPDSGFDGLSQFTVYPIPSSYVSPSYTQSSKTWTPGTSNQYISSGTYCSGQQTIKGDSNLTAANIKSGVNIFGVTGTCKPNGAYVAGANSDLLSNTISFVCSFEPKYISVVPFEDKVVAEENYYIIRSLIIEKSPFSLITSGETNASYRAVVLYRNAYMYMADDNRTVKKTSITPEVNYGYQSDLGANGVKITIPVDDRNYFFGGNYFCAAI